jgi:teichuronic acid biosynthesis glycosyltransferase TuaG
MDFIYHDLNIIQNGIVIKKMKSRHLSVKDPYHDLLYGSYGIPTSSVCVRKDIFTNSIGFAEVQELVGLEDFNLWLQLAKNGIRFKYMPLALGTYFLGTENLSFNDENRIFRYKYLFKKIIDSEENSHTKKKLSATLNYYISWIYFNNRNFKKAILPTIHSLCYGSISIKLAVFRSVLKALIKV